jgi:hypothetical protein
VVTQPLILGAGLGDGLFEGLAGCRDRLAQAYAVPALGDQEVRDGAGPIAGANHADGQRVGEVEMRE